MRLDDLHHAVSAHAGEFTCERIGRERTTRVVRFAHAVTPPSGTGGVPDVGRLRDVYDTFGEVVFYLEPDSGDAARRLAPPSEWPVLRAAFEEWLDMLDEEEADGLGWLDDAVVIGETPQSGNYVLLATTGDAAGHVVEFDHDGFEFRDRAPDAVTYVEAMLRPHDARLTDFASHMRFTAGNGLVQWWIREMRDNRGHVARTRA